MRFSSGVLFFALLIAVCRVPALAQVPPVPTGARNLLLPPGIMQSYASFVKPMERQTGLIDLLRKDDEVFLDLRASQLNEDFLIEPVLAKGVGSGAFAGRMYEAFIVRFERHGNKILWVSPNVDFSEITGTTRQAVDSSTGDSVLAVTPIVAEDVQAGRIVIAPSILLTDLENVGAELGRRLAQPVAGPIPGLVIRAPAAFGLDAQRTYIDNIKVLPANDEISVVLGFTGPPNLLLTVPDSRGFSLKMHYSIIALKQSATYMPRLADDRIGYQLTTHARLGDTAAPTPLVRYINRWDMTKGPVIFYLSDSIPQAYRNPIRSALLSWNGVFAKAGWKNAVEVRDQPKDPAWDPDDARYSVVRWISSLQPDFAGYTGTVSNPITGEILRAGIVIDGEDVRQVQADYRDYGLALRAQARNDCADSECAYAAEYADQASFARTSLIARGITVNREQFARDWIRSVVLHESGHAFGLRHNFAGSMLYTPRQLHDAAFTATHGISGSVMDYTPVNVAASARQQGAFFQQIFGPYDYWAIKYGYVRIPGVRYPADEKPFLRTIAQQSTLPGHAYGPDEEAFGAGWIDPRVSPFDLSSDPLEYDREQFALSHELLKKLDRNFAWGDTSYYQERLAFTTIVRNQIRAATLALRYVGGEYTSRSHAGQRGGVAPFRPIPRSQARRAFVLLSDNIFADGSFTFPPGLISHLGTEGFYDLAPPATRPDFPVSQYSGSVQDFVLQHLFDPTGLGRIFDNQVQAKRGEDLTRLEDVFEWTRASVWSELNQRGTVRISPLRRELQRHFTDMMAVYAMLPTGVLAGAGAPRESQALARYELQLIGQGSARALRSGTLDVATRAHLLEEQARVDRALHAVNFQNI